jgi:aquaporin Z
VGFAGIPIGIVLVLVHLVGIPVTNTSVNPARSIGPAVFVGGCAIGQLWLFIIAPLIGAAIAAMLYKMVSASETVITARAAETALPSEQAERPRQPLGSEAAIPLCGLGAPSLNNPARTWTAGRRSRRLRGQ